MVSINHPTLTIHSQHAVSIAIEGKAHGGTTCHHRFPQGFEMGGPATNIDAGAIRFSVQHREIGTKSLKHLRTEGRGRSPTEIQHQLHPLESLPRHAGQQTIPVMLEQFRPVVGGCTGRLHLGWSGGG